MKTLLKFFLFMAVISLVAGCNKTDDPLIDDNVALKSAQPITVTLPFEANLLGQITNLVSDDSECINEGYAYHVIVEASGNATHLGKVSITFDFCTLGPANPNISEPNNTYAGCSSVMTAANGDKLFLDIEGSTIIYGRTDEHPDYVSDYWRGIANITGGTGRFEGASGVLQMDDYSTFIDSYSHHHWTGEITLVKGKR